MAYIKKLVLTGFKSFARKTEVIFDKGITVVLGPNGSGKSNLSDALCFVLGRLSIKSMRAAKASNLIFMGSKFIKPAKEASVEMIFDNSDRAFNTDRDEITLERVVRRSGQSIYKINGEAKTRAEVVEMLAQAGIDPHGFNIVLQGGIDAIIRMHPEERRKIVEEVAGIAIYESRKEKSIKELEKTEERLKEISTILRERTAYLNNLDRERAQALKFKEFENTVKRAKASIIHRKLEDKKKEVGTITKSIEGRTTEKDKTKEKADKFVKNLDELSEKINAISKHIQKASGVEQDSLHNAIVTLRAELSGLEVKKENYENRKREIERRIEEIGNQIPELEKEIRGLREKSPLMAKKSEELKRKKEELGKIEEERKKLLSLKSELDGLKERVKDKREQIGRTKADGEILLKQLEEHSLDLKYKNGEECNKEIKEFIDNLGEMRKKIDGFVKKEIESEKIISVGEAEILESERIKKKVGEIDVCPMCQSKITENHKEHVFREAGEKKESAEKRIERAKEELEKSKEERRRTIEEIRHIEKSISEGEKELGMHISIKEKKEQLKKAVEREQELEKEIKHLEEKRKNLEGREIDAGKIDERYENKMLEIEEISSRTEENVDTSLLYKERDLENIINIVKRSKKDFEDVGAQVKEILGEIESREKLLEEQEEKEKELNERFKKMFADREETQRKIQEDNMKLSQIQSEVRQIEEQVNYLRIGKAKLDAEAEGLEMEMADFVGVELITGSMQVIEERLRKAQEGLSTIGSINMRALEVYEEVKKEYDAVYEKVTTLGKEKEEIMKIIEEIDRKKTKTFMRTFNAISELFSSNFARLYTKGVAFLEIENKEDIFAGGVNIVVKLAKGKYFDITSLSGGEKTLVALALLFAIQEHKPYHFYIFDEIDAALDKRNSERLAGLLTHYMKSGQYIVITHNDAIILNSNVLYGVSMQDNVSKVLSLKVN